MATKDKKPAVKKATSSTKKTVTRIVATDTKKATAKTETAAETIKTSAKKADKAVASSTKKPATATPAVNDNAKKNVFAAIGGYFAGAWYELKQVNWPNRKATWSLTAAMIAFTGFFVVLILLLDALFKYLFELILV